ncbi:MAG: hypothetical protein AAGH88_12555 [Planctomycetota bacterium]
MSGKQQKTKRANTPVMASASPQGSTDALDSAAKRRLRYGLNVGLAVAIAVTIVVVLNWLVYTQYRGLSPDARQWVRYDLTTTRSYSLSDQTRDVLDGLTQPHQIISMLGGLDANEVRDQRVRDLIDEYARNSKLLEAEHLELAEDQARRSEVLAEMSALFADDTASIREALIQGFDDLDRIDRAQSENQRVLSQVIELDVLTIQRDRQALSDLNARYLQLAQRADQAREARATELGIGWRNQLDQPAKSANDGEDLPDYTELLAQLQGYFVTLYQEVLPATDDVLVTKNLISRIRTTGVDAPARRRQVLQAKNDLVRISQTIRPPGSTAQLGTEGIFRELTDILRPLLLAEVPYRYDESRAIISDRPCLIIRTPSVARVVPAERLFRGQADASPAADGNEVQEQFLGEEQLTGAFISLTLDPPPLIIFVRSNLPTPALTSMRVDPAGSQNPNAAPIAGLYNHVAMRLRALGFEVAQWKGIDDPPLARENQRVVWVTMPFIRPNPRNAASMDPTLKNKVFGHVKERLAYGDAALVMLSQNEFVDPERSGGDSVRAEVARTLADDAQVGLLRDWGIDAQVYQFAFMPTQENDEGRATRSTSSFVVTQWPDGSFVEVSLRGIPTYFRVAHPLLLREAGGVEHTELARIDQPGVFVQRFQPEETGLPIRTEPGSERDHVLVAVAAKRGKGRLITVGDGFWATDEATTLGRLPDGREGPGLATQPGASVSYPGNTELFVASVFWLANQEQLIASSPRTQDLRRIEPIEPTTLSVYRGVLVAGLPGLVFVIGVAVWLVRRRA